MIYPELALQVGDAVCLSDDMQGIVTGIGEKLVERTGLGLVPVIIVDVRVALPDGTVTRYQQRFEYPELAQPLPPRTPRTPRTPKRTAQPHRHATKRIVRMERSLYGPLYAGG